MHTIGHVQSVKGFTITRSKLANQQIASLIKIASVFNNVSIIYRSGARDKIAKMFILNPIRSGHFRQLTIRGGGALKAPPPLYDLENYCVNLYHIIHVHFTRCFRHVLIAIFFNKFAILTILQRFQNKK